MRQSVTFRGVPQTLWLAPLRLRPRCISMPFSSSAISCTGTSAKPPTLEFVDSLASETEADEHDEVLTIQSAHCAATRSAATRLLQDRYRWRGYSEAGLPPIDCEGCFPLLVTRVGRPVGTLTVSLDKHAGLAAERTFPDEVRAFRNAGVRLSEFTRLAVDSHSGSPHVLVSLFQVGYLAASRLGGADRAVMEVNPRHVAYYVRMLGAKVCGPCRTHAGANAPAVLLCIAFEDVKERIADFLRRLDGGPVPRRSPYAQALTVAAEAAILDRLSQHVCAPLTDRKPFLFRLERLARAPACSTSQTRSARVVLRPVA